MSARHARSRRAGRWSASPSPLHAFCGRIWARRGHSVAIVACARKLACLFWCPLTREEDYGYAQPSLTAKKLRLLELRAGAPTRQGIPSRTWPTRQRMRAAEQELATRAESAYKRTVVEWQRTQANKSKGAGATGRAYRGPSSGQAARQNEAPPPPLCVTRLSRERSCESGWESARNVPEDQRGVVAELCAGVALAGGVVGFRGSNLAVLGEPDGLRRDCRSKRSSAAARTCAAATSGEASYASGTARYCWATRGSRRRHPLQGTIYFVVDSQSEHAHGRPVGTISTASDVTDRRIETASLIAVAQPVAGSARRRGGRCANGDGGRAPSAPQ